MSSYSELGYFALRSYYAYKDEYTLDLAISSWQDARQYTISDNDISAGSIGNKDFNLLTSCDGGMYCVSANHFSIAVSMLQQVAVLSTSIY